MSKITVLTMIQILVVFLSQKINRSGAYKEHRVGKNRDWHDSIFLDFCMVLCGTVTLRPDNRCATNGYADLSTGSSVSIFVIHFCVRLDSGTFADRTTDRTTQTPQNAWSESNPLLHAIESSKIIQNVSRYNRITIDPISLYNFVPVLCFSRFRVDRTMSCLVLSLYC